MAVILHISFEEMPDGNMSIHPSIDVQADNFTHKELTAATTIAKAIMGATKENVMRQLKMKDDTKIPPNDLH